jgi:predicted nucleotidyltransferase
MKFGLKETNTEKISEIFNRYPQVEKAVLYGSRAKGNYKTGSDIDLTLSGCPDLTIDVLYRIMDDIDDLYLPYHFDLSILQDIQDQDVLDHIRRVGVVFYERKEISTHESTLTRGQRGRP